MIVFQTALNHAARELKASQTDGNYQCAQQ